MTKANFISKVVNELLEDNFSVLFLQEKNIDNCGGIFNGGDKEFIVAIKNKMGFEVLVHEYCHYLQWKYDRSNYNRLINGHAIIADWLDGKFFKKSIIKYAIDLIIELEWDCELRSVDLIKKNKLDINLESYIQGANSYILYYHIVRKTRTFGGRTIYKPSLLKSMPTKIMDLEYYLDENNISEKQYRKYSEYFR